VCVCVCVCDFEVSDIRRALQQQAVSYIVVQLSENVLHLEVCSLDTVPAGCDAVLDQRKLNSPLPLLENPVNCSVM
jgi:hypothetical protein